MKYEDKERLNILKENVNYGATNEQKQNDIEWKKAGANSYDTPSSDEITKVEFTKNVLILLSIQFLFPILFLLLQELLPKLRTFQQEFKGILFFFFCTSIIILGMFYYGKNLSKKEPINFILFILFSFAQAYFTSGIVSFLDKGLVGIGALSITIEMIFILFMVISLQRELTVKDAMSYATLIGVVQFGLYTILSKGKIGIVFVGTLAATLIWNYCLCGTLFLTQGNEVIIETDDAFKGMTAVYIEFLKIINYIVKNIQDIIPKNN